MLCFPSAGARTRGSDGQMYLVKGQTNLKEFQVKQRPFNKFPLGSGKVRGACVKGKIISQHSIEAQGL